MLWCQVLLEARAPLLPYLFRIDGSLLLFVPAETAWRFQFQCHCIDLVEGGGDDDDGVEFLDQFYISSGGVETE